MVKVVDPKNLAPDRFVGELSKCLDLLPFKLDDEIAIYVEEHNVDSNALAWNGVDYRGAELQMAIKLFARDIYANVQHNRINYWLFITLHEFAHVHYRQQRPEAALDDLEDECDTIAHDTLQAYKQKHK